MGRNCIFYDMEVCKTVEVLLAPELCLWDCLDGFRSSYACFFPAASSGFNPLITGSARSLTLLLLGVFTFLLVSVGFFFSVPLLIVSSLRCGMGEEFVWPDLHMSSMLVCPLVTVQGLFAVPGRGSQAPSHWLWMAWGRGGCFWGLSIVFFSAAGGISSLLGRIFFYYLYFIFLIKNC